MMSVEIYKHARRFYPGPVTGRDEQPGLGSWGDCWAQFLKLGWAERKTTAVLAVVVVLGKW